MATQEKIEVMQAYLDGKQIQLKDCDGKWVNWTDAKHREPNWNWETGSYRIKPEPTYRPYKNTEEMIADFKERFNVNVPDYAMPLIWLKAKRIEYPILITSYCDEDSATRFSCYFENYTYLDGSPVGKLVE